MGNKKLPSGNHTWVIFQHTMFDGRYPISYCTMTFRLRRTHWYRLWHIHLL